MAGVEEQIGELKASLESRKEENRRIETHLDAMVKSLNDAQLKQVDRDTQLSSELTKITTALTSEHERMTEYVNQQKEQDTNIRSLQHDVMEVNNNVKNLLTLTADAESIHKEFDGRIRKLERLAIGVYSAGVILVALVVAIIYVSQAVSGVRDMIQIQAEQQERLDQQQSLRK